MENQCKFPLCERHAEKNGYCIGHRIYAGATVETKKPVPIAKRSKKMIEEMKVYKPMVTAYLNRRENKICHIKSPVCTGKATCVNHKKRRGKNLCNEEYFEASCEPCNNYLEANTQWAIDNGHLISVHKIDTSKLSFE